MAHGNFTKKQLQQKVVVCCYDKWEKMTREEALDLYFEGMMCCEGSERERYTNIYCQLLAGGKRVSDKL